MSFPRGCWCHHRRDNLQYLLLLRLALPLGVTGADHVDGGADGGVSLLVDVDGPDLHEDVREDLDVEVVRHHAQDQPVPEVEDALQILRSLVRHAKRTTLQLELETKVKQRFANISQSQRRPLLGPSPC